MRLRPLGDDETSAFRERHRVEYRTQLVEWAGMSDALAARKAEEDTVSLPEGSELFGLETEGGSIVGTILFGQREYYGEARLFLYDLWVEPSERGRGYGRAALGSLEAEARRRGLSTIEFNVWGGNAVARSLYRSTGYEERSVFMSKDL